MPPSSEHDALRDTVRSTYAAIARSDAAGCGPSCCGSAGDVTNMIGDAYDTVDGYVSDRSDRYSYDVVAERDPADGTFDDPSDPGHAGSEVGETNTFVARAAHTLTHSDTASTEIGFSTLYGALHDDVDDVGLHGRGETVGNDQRCAPVHEFAETPQRRAGTSRHVLRSHLRGLPCEGLEQVQGYHPGGYPTLYRFQRG